MLLTQRAVRFLTLWIGTYYSVDLTRKRCLDILELFEDVDQMKQNQLKLLMLKVLSFSTHLQMDKKQKGSIRKTLRKDLLSESQQLTFLEMRVEEVAFALTQHEAKLFYSIQPQEFLAKIGWYITPKTVFQNITNLINRFNEVSYNFEY